MTDHGELAVAGWQIAQVSCSLDKLPWLLSAWWTHGDQPCIPRLNETPMDPAASVTSQPVSESSL